MAVTRYAGDRYTCLSTDSKPSGTDGAFLIELDLKRSFIWSGMWNQLPTGSGGGGTTTASGFAYIYREKWRATGNVASGEPINVPNNKTYVSGQNRLQVYVGGMFQMLDTTAGTRDNDYWEVVGSPAPAKIAFNYYIPSGANVDFVIFSEN